MAFTLQALIGREFELRDLAATHQTMQLVPLLQGLIIVPLTVVVREETGIPLLPLTPEDDSKLPAALDKLGRQVSKLGKVGYIEAEIFGGSGNQAGIVWDKQARIWGPVISSGSINDVLKILSVEKGPHLDEFAALDLGRHRHTDQWITNTQDPG